MGFFILPDVELGVFAGKWAACQIGAKSELSGDYSPALLTAGGAEWASITLERRV